MTIEDVMAEAGISRGSVLHQFPNRTELSVETAKVAMAAVVRKARELASRIEDPFQRLCEYGQIVWETHAMKEGLALTEILQATRWDKALALAIMPIIREAEAQVAIELVALARNAGIPDPEVMIARGWLLVASARGLIIESRLGFERPMIEQAIAEMKESHRRYCQRLATLAEERGCGQT